MKKNKCGDLGNYVQNVVDKIDNNDFSGGGSNPPQEGPLVITNAEYSTKTENSITVTACATDENNEKLTYKLYTRKLATENFPEETEWTERGSLTEQTSGEPVTLTANGLDEYTYYYWKVDVSNGTLSNTSGKMDKIRTYCTGKGLMCNGPWDNNCEECTGNGNIKCNGTYSKMDFSHGNNTRDFACDTCNKSYSYFYTVDLTCSICGKLSISMQGDYCRNQCAYEEMKKQTTYYGMPCIAKNICENCNGQRSHV